MHRVAQNWDDAKPKDTKTVFQKAAYPTEGYMKVVLEFDDHFSKKYSEHDLKMYCAVGLYKERIMNTGIL
jgi:hypothetical protein